MARLVVSLNTVIHLLLVLSLPEFLVAAQEDFVSTDKVCYVSGEHPSISFEAFNPTEDDWIGIYPSSLVSPHEDPSLWLWTCGTQQCWGKMNRGTISFGSSADYVDIWPLDLGSYRAVLARDAVDDQSSYDFYATSDLFAVQDSCGPITLEPTSAPPTTLSPTTLPPKTLSPTTLSPTSSTPTPTTPPTTLSPTTLKPSLRPTSTATTSANTKTNPQEIPKNMAAVIAAAKTDIAYLVIANPPLSALFLRMMFHDCVGGRCDGCINMANPDNAKLDSVMYSLETLVNKYEPLGLTRPDLWALATTTGIELSMPDDEFVAIPFTTIGRQPCSATEITQGPNPEIFSHNIDTDDIITFFRAHFAFTPQEAAAILGGNTIGVMEREVLGFDGPNGRTLDSSSFNNAYFKELIGHGTSYQEQIDNAPNWQQVFVDNSDLPNIPSRYQWVGFPNGIKIVMRNSDIALVRQLNSNNKADSGRVGCQFVPRGGDKATCPRARNDLFVQMVKYRNDNRLFLEDFRDALIKLTQTGYSIDSISCDSDGVCRLIQV